MVYKIPCRQCGEVTEHGLEYIEDMAQRPAPVRNVRGTCIACSGVNWATDDIYDDPHELPSDDD